MPLARARGRLRQRGAAGAPPPALGVDRPRSGPRHRRRRGSLTSGGPRDRERWRRTCSRTWSGDRRGPSVSPPSRVPADPAEVLPAAHRACARGALALLRRPGRLRARARVLAAWIILPLVLYSLSSFRTPRFVFPILPALALCAGHALVTARPARRRAIPSAPWSPSARSSSPSSSGWTPSLPHAGPERRLQAERAAIQAVAPAGESVPYLGNHYWASANPLLYYAERYRAASSQSAGEAVDAARRHGGRLLLVTRRRLPELAGLDRSTRGRPGRARLGAAALHPGGRPDRPRGPALRDARSSSRCSRDRRESARGARAAIPSPPGAPCRGSRRA